MHYQAPERDYEFLLFDLFKVGDVWRNIPQFADFSDDLVRAVVSEGGKLATEVMAPLNQIGDELGCEFDKGVVTTPKGFKQAYEQIAVGGWLGISGNPEFGGQGMPKLMGCLLEEMFWSANPALYLYGTLSVGSSISIEAHGSTEQKALYLPKLYSGEWSGVMALTESHAGTDLGIIRTKAEPKANGAYAVTGTKIFITSGEHDMVENIVHLVLAKLPGAPAGSKGISLFLVPKFLINEDGSLGERNTMGSGAIEHKMGINGSATNVINYEGAEGYLVGDENQGLACMFTMMNYERLSVGLQGLGAGELAYQQSAAYAKDRLQGRSPTGPKNAAGEADSLLVHPDVRRMLLTQRAFNEAGRAFAMFAGMQLDRARYDSDKEALALSELLTPITKAFLTDRGFECAVTAQQVFGGHGYIKEWGVEQIVRDARIAQIYEGTNGVQAADLIGRKVLKDGGRNLQALIAKMRATPISDKYQEQVEAYYQRLLDVTDSLVTRTRDDANLAGSVANDYLDMVGYVIFAWLWARMVGAVESAESNVSSEFAEAKKATADFYFARLLPRALGCQQSISAESDVVMNFSDEAF